jgi:pilus assembly protein CpaE
MNAPFTPRAGTRAPFSAFLCDLDAEDVARATASSFDWALERIHNGGVRHAVQSLAVSPSPSVLLVDLSDSADPLDDINALAEVCEPGTMVIACGHINDVRFYRELISSGLHDYLLKPFTEGQLREIILAAQAVQMGARAAETAHGVQHLSTAVVGVRGGSGASSIAVSLASILAERGRTTAMLDLDIHFGTAALAFDLEPGRGLTDAVENPGRIDGLFIERALARVSERLGVLSAEAPLSRPLTGDGSAFLQLQNELKGAYECSVIDLPRHMLVQHPGLLQHAGVAIVVTELTLAATRDTIRILAWLRANASNTRVIVVANKTAVAGQDEVARKEFEGSIERKIDVLLPYDAKLAAQAAKLGKPLSEVAKAAKLGACLEALGDLLVGEGEDSRKTSKSLIGRLGDVRAMLARKPAA